MQTVCAMSADRTRLTCSVLGKRGRLGNQLFQLAALIGVAKRSGADIVLPKDLLDRSEDGQKCVLSLFAASTMFPMSLEPDAEVRTLKEMADYRYQWVEPEEGRTTDMVGFWQHPRYFLHAEREVRAAFEIADLTLLQEARATASRLRLEHDKKRLVCLHMRFGDFLAQRERFFVPDAAFLGRLLATVDVRDSLVVVFAGGAHTASGASDHDIALRTMQGANCDWLMAPGRNTTESDFLLMRECDDFLLTGGTFGWWAAFLSTASADKRVVEPLPWFVSMDGYEQPPGFQYLEVEGWCPREPVDPMWRVVQKRAEPRTVEPLAATTSRALAICLTVFNRGEHLLCLLGQLEAMAAEIEPFKVVITDWGSTDLDVAALARASGAFPITVVKNAGRFDLGGGWTTSVLHESIQHNDLVFIMCNDLEITSSGVFADARLRARLGASVWVPEHACRDRQGGTVFAGGAACSAIYKRDYLRCGGWGEGTTWGGDDDVYMRRVKAASLTLIYQREPRVIAAFHERDTENDPWYVESSRKNEQHILFRK